jgi:hypothetical protein
MMLTTYSDHNRVLFGVGEVVSSIIDFAMLWRSLYC